MNLISIDFGKFSTGLYVKSQGQEYSLNITNKKNCLHAEALKNIFDSMMYTLVTMDIDIGFIEGYAFNMKNATSIPIMGEVGGVIKLAFACLHIPIVSIPVPTWKSLTIGKISKSKNEKEYRAAVKKKYGKEFDTLDQLDAFLIYKAVEEIVKSTKRTTDTMKKIKEQIVKIKEA